MRTLIYKTLKQLFYFEIGSIFASSADLAYLGWGICQFLPRATSTGNEFLLFSHLTSLISTHSSTQIPKEFNALVNSFPASQLFWHNNQRLLSEIPTSSNEDLQLLRFLQERCLAKVAGFSSLAIDWVYPCFDVNVQIHPFSNHSYARLLTSGFSKAYKNRVKAWKQSLPYPSHYPLILTRPANLQDYLPSYLEVLQDEKIRVTVKKLALKMRGDNEKIIVDVSALFPEEPKKWLAIWETYHDSFAEICKKYHLDMTRILCIHRIYQKDIGGIRLLHLAQQSSEILKQNHQFLLDWISCLGLTANRVELDRWPIISLMTPFKEKKPASFKKLPSKKAIISILNSFEEKLHEGPPHKMLMLRGTLQVLKGLFIQLTEDKWQKTINCPTRSSIAQFSINKIIQQLKLLAKNQSEASFFSMASSLEQIHVELSSLLEIFMPFHSNQFSPIYQDLLSIPTDLKPFVSCGVHSSAMTSLAGIFKAVEKTLKRKPRVLYGENTYFECIHTTNKITYAIPVDKATEEDWKEADILLAQFNPVLKLENHTGYRAEKIVDIVYKCLNTRDKKPLTLALDCTIDFIHSPRVTHLLHQFQKEIKEGSLNIISYRSGNKFDLFGMDNYCGSPFFMIHNQDPQWAFFDLLLKDPALQTDSLSFNWFCLAYRYAAPQLELYRKQIFDNTRALLNKLPSRLLNDLTLDYHVSPFDQETEPAFIDIKITGPFHAVRGSALVAGTLFLKSLKAGHPIFNRPSLGFYHPNFIMLFGKDNSTLRLTLGLDPAQVHLFAKCLEIINTLNER